MCWVKKIENLTTGGVDYSGLESTQAKTNAPMSQTSSESLKLIIQTD